MGAGEGRVSGGVRQVGQWMREPHVGTDIFGSFYSVPTTAQGKHRWIFLTKGQRYKVRLCMDMKNGGLNDLFQDWPFRYLGIHNVVSTVKQGDWLVTIDISRFYLRLPAGSRLRSVQWFQDPSTYSDSTRNNNKKNVYRLCFRQLLIVAFGLKSAPAYVSVVSVELARILTS